MKLFKKVLSVLIVCTMIFPLASVSDLFGNNSAFAQETNEAAKITKDGITYLIANNDSNKICAISRIDESVSGDVVIPENVDGYTVTKIDSSAIIEADNVTSITIPSGFTENINLLLYLNSDTFKKIIVDEKNPVYSSDEHGVLYNKDKTEIIILPSGCEIGSFTIPASVTYISSSSFGRGTSVGAFYVDPENANYSSDENGVLYNKDKTSLIRYPSGNGKKEYTVSADVTTIAQYAFAYSQSLENISIPENVTNISYAAFLYCTALKRIDMSYECSGYDIFTGCNYASKITADDNSVIIEWGAESSPATAISIGKNISDLSWCKNLNGIINGFGEITVEEGNENFTVADGVLYDKNIETLLLFPSGTDRKTYVMPDSVKDIDDGYFKPFKNLTSVTLGKSFSGHSIYGETFLEEETESKGEWMGYYTYYSLIKSCLYTSSLEEINVCEDNPYFCSEDGVLYSKDKKAVVIYPLGKPLGDITIDNDTVVCKFAYIGKADKITFGEKFSENFYNGVYKALELQNRDLSESNVKYEFSRILAGLFMSSTAKEYVTSENDKYLSSVDGVLYAFDESVLVKYPIGNNKNFYDMPETVTGIAMGWENDISTTPFNSIHVDFSNISEIKAYYQKDYLTVHLNSDLISSLSLSSCYIPGVNKICVDGDPEVVSELNKKIEEYKSYYTNLPEYNYKMAVKSSLMGGMPLWYVDYLIERINQVIACINPIEVCGGAHTFGLTSENENVIAEYDIGCFGNLDKKVYLNVEETNGEKAEEMASIILQNFDNVFPTQIYNISTVDSDGELVQPANGKVKIKIKLPEDYNTSDKFIVFHWLSDTNKLKTYSGDKVTVETIDGVDFLVFEVEHFSLFAVAVITPEEETPVLPSVSIKNKDTVNTIRYGETIRLTANTENMTEGSKIFWYAGDEKVGEGETLEIAPKENIKITVKIVDANGTPCEGEYTSDSQTITVKANIFWKIIAFFRNLLGINKIISQAIGIKLF